MIGGIITPFLEFFVGHGNVTDHLVRKLAHFCEYAALGLDLSLIFQLRKKTKLYDCCYLIFASCFVATIDEGIQLFSDGRGAQVQDVLLDTVGAITGIFIFGGIFYWIRKVCTNRKKKFRMG